MSTLSSSIWALDVGEKTRHGCWWACWGRRQCIGPASSLNKSWFEDYEGACSPRWWKIRPRPCCWPQQTPVLRESRCQLFFCLVYPYQRSELKAEHIMYPVYYKYGSISYSPSGIRWNEQIYCISYTITFMFGFFYYSFIVNTVYAGTFINILLF